MKIDGITSDTRAGRLRVSARISWEERARDDLRLFYELPAALTPHEDACAQAFAVACALPAQWHGERRLQIEGALCSELRQGLYEALSWFRHWYRPDARALDIDCASSDRAATDARAAGLFLSGGVDSVAALADNHDRLSPEDRAFIRQSLFVYGFDIGWPPDRPDAHNVRGRALDAVRNIAASAGVQVDCVHTNLRCLEPDPHFWIYQYHGSALASVAHLFEGRIHTVEIPGLHHVSEAKAWGSNPFTDPCYSSGRLRVRYAGLQFTRQAKVARVAAWDAGLHNLRVCSFMPPDRLNCGRCEKCVRTMLCLEVAGALERTAGFGARQVTPDILAGITIYTPLFAQFYAECRDRYRVEGQHDRAAALDRVLRRYRSYRRKCAERDVRGWIKRADRAIAGGRLRRWYDRRCSDRTTRAE